MIAEITGRLLVVGAHCFDAEVMAGGLIRKTSKNGMDAHILHLSMGELGHKTKTSEEYAKQKRYEAQKAAEILGASVEFANFPDAFVPAGEEAAMVVCGVIRTFKPDIVVTHWNGGWHKDHIATHNAVIQGVFYAGLPSIKPELPAHSISQILFGENWEDGEEMRPTLYYDITESIQDWHVAISAYALGRGELCDFPYHDYYESLKRLRGCLIRSGYAEAFAQLDVTSVLGLCQFASR